MTLNTPPTAASFARLVGVSRQRAAILREQGVVSGDTLAEWVGSYCANLREQAAGHGGEGQLVLAQERAALAAAQRRRIEREERIAAGSYLLTADVVKSQTRAGMAIRDAMLAVPGRTAATLAGMDDERAIDRYLTTELRAELTRLADSVPRQ
jgi:terminase small subunit / prophage DNA-packing protein